MTEDRINAFMTRLEPDYGNHPSLRGVCEVVAGIVLGDDEYEDDVAEFWKRYEGAQPPAGLVNEAFVEAYTEHP